MNEIVIQLREDIAGELLGREKLGQAAQQIVELANECQAKLIPQAPQDWGKGSSYFSIMQSDFNRAQQVAQRLAKCPGVDAAYVKPPSGLP